MQLIACDLSMNEIDSYEAPLHAKYMCNIMEKLVAKVWRSQLFLQCTYSQFLTKQINSEIGIDHLNKMKIWGTAQEYKCKFSNLSKR